MMRVLLIVTIISGVFYSVTFSAGPLWTKHVIDDGFTRAYDVYAADLDNDGDQDVIGAAYDADEMAWWENEGGNLEFTKHVLTAPYQNPICVHADDLDNDGDVDILAASYVADKISLWENLGNGEFFKRLVGSGFHNACNIYAVDLDGDDDVDIIGAAEAIGEIAWWENSTNWIWIKHTIVHNFTDVRSVYAADMDGDNDIDVIGAAQEENEISWWENDGSENFIEHSIATWFVDPIDIYCADLDSDNDIDVIGAGAGMNQLAWWENDGEENFNKHIIDTLASPQAVQAIDVDGDLDVDIVGTSAGSDFIAWWENREYLGGFRFIRHSLGSFPYARGVYARDFDGDDDIDILGTSYNAGVIAWWELLNFPACDAEVSMHPDDDPIIVPAGGSFGFTGTLENPNEYALNTDVWTTVSMNEHSFFLQRFLNIVLTPHQEISMHFEQEVPDSAPPGDYIYRANCGDFFGWFPCDLDSFIFTVAESTGFNGNGEGDTGTIFEEYNPCSNVPNPFNAKTAIFYTLPERSKVRLEIYNLRGQRVTTLVDGPRSAGKHSVTWDATRAASGVYFYKLTIGSDSFINKMLLLK
ncbi:MAG: T9SS type A sorting domain-containing protein [candidate division Zixibacteria bacterium]|nr:T9SS type A sorting domain-containing protein [candidate division Zixibacteria bacterium]